MKSGNNYVISLKELASRSRPMVARRSGISYQKALEQIQLLKENSKVRQDAKKSNKAA